MDRIGIVLKKYFPAKCKISVLEKELGRAEYIPRTEDICLGSLIRYSVHSTRGMHVAHDIEKLAVPLHLGAHDILFFHHVLELSYFFVPLGSAMDELFELIAYLYINEHIPLSGHFKKLFLMKFFVIMGIYPEKREIRSPYFCRLAATSIDILAQQDLDLSCQQELDAWLRACILVHPQQNIFKTLHFLDESKEA